MKCYVHNEADAVGTCVNCGKFICAECNTAIEGKNYCKACVNEVFSNLKTDANKPQQPTQAPPPPMVFMNAGGGSSSSSSSSAAAAGSGRRGRRGSCLIHIILFFCTAGIGNIIYYLYCRNRDN